MLVQCGVVGLDEEFEAFATAEGVLECGGFRAKCGTGGAHGG